MKCFILMLLTTILAINQAVLAKVNQQYAYKAKEDHSHHQHLHFQPIQPNQHEDKHSNQVSQPMKRAQEIVASYNPYDRISKPQEIHSPPDHPSTAQSYQKRYTNVNYNVVQNLDAADASHLPTYHQSPGMQYSLEEMTQQEKPSLLAQLKRQQQDLSEGYAIFLQNDEDQHQQQSGSFVDDNQAQSEETHQTNPHVLHYQRQLQQQQEQQKHLYYQQLQQKEQLQQQKPPPFEGDQRLRQILFEPQQQALAYVTAIAAQSPEITTPAPLTTTQATIHPNLHHQSPKTLLAPPTPSLEIVSHATGNEASPSATINLKAYQSLAPPPPPSEHQRNRLPHGNAFDSGVKYATTNYHHQPYSLPPAALPLPLERHPAEVYGLPPQQTLMGSKHSKQVLYAPMRYLGDRKLPYTSKTFPYPPSFISLTTTERPMKYDHGSPHYYSYDHKSAYNKIPDLFDHRNAKSLLDSYIPSWKVVQIMQEYQHGAYNQNINLQTLATPHKGYFKRNANNQGNY
ncbi:uncharacterized protein LOC142229848 [Haematobia irritans]|uniref:uncharacterized protein LOC142229848 n=1 Tax=Haematobia irritans TaxID=7368 RepID=UPI003F50A992